MNETMLAAMHAFAEVAAARSFTLAARRLAMSKQTLSRRVAELERALGVKLLHRTTRRVRLTDVGAAYAERCAEIARLAEEANRAVGDAEAVPRGTLRVTADPVFGEAFVTGLILDYARRWPEVRVEVALTRRRVDLVEEGFDVAFRIGAVEDAALAGTRLGPARVRICASPAYLRKHGRPRTPRELASHQCLPVGEQTRWPFRGKRGIELIPVEGRLRFDSFAMARAAALAGLGIAIFPEFTCARDLARRRLVSLLDDFSVEVGGVWLVHPRARAEIARVRAFVELALSRLAARPPWAALIRRSLFSVVVTTAALEVVAMAVLAFWPTPGKYPLVLVAAAAASVWGAWRYRVARDDFGALLLGVAFLAAFATVTLARWLALGAAAILVFAGLLILPGAALLLALVAAGSADYPYDK